MVEKRQKLNGISFIRAICSLGIVLYHFSAASACPLKILFGNANGNWGEAFVALFFIVSGFSLYYNHKEEDITGDFYFRRFKSIFPSFWIGYIIIFVIKVIENGRFFYLDGIASRSSLLLSVIGMDGYFLYRIPNYYLIGEWFLGAIILIYLLYPLIIKAFNIAGELITGILFVIFIILVYRNPFMMVPFRNLLSCLFFFMVGLLICKYRDRLISNRLFLVLSLIVSFIMAFVHLPLPEDICKGMLGIALFIPLYSLGELACKNILLLKITGEFSSVSYEVFLLHHVIIYKILQFVNPVSKKKMLIILLGTLILIYISAGLLKTLRNQIITLNLQKFSDSALRLSELDIAKGIAIISVMLVHLPREYRLIPDGITFHLAVFFAVSGILLSEKKYDIRKDLRRILLPYLILSVIYICYVSIKYFCTGHPEMIIGDAEVYAFYTVTLVGCGTLWFLPTLFISRVITALCRRITSEKYTLLLSGVFVFSVLSAYFLQQKGLCGAPQALSATAVLHNILIVLVQSFIAAGISGLGIMIWKFLNRKDSISRTICITMICLVLNFLFYYLYDGNDLHFANIIQPLGYMVGILFGCTGILGLSKLISKVPYISSVLIFFGINSLIIMTTHLEYDFLKNTALFTGIVSQSPVLRHILPIFMLCIIEAMICLIVNATPLKKIFRPFEKSGLLKER